MRTASASRGPEWDQRKLFYHCREHWAEHTNRALELAGHDKRSDHRSYETRGIDLVPQRKLYRHVDDVQGITAHAAGAAVKSKGACK